MIFLRKIYNTFLSSFFRKRSVKYINSNVDIWKDGDTNLTEYYSEINDLENKFINYILNNTRENDSVLDICCNQGRFLYALRKHGYNDLRGFDIMKTAIVSFKNNPLYDPSILNIEHCLAEDYFMSKPDKSIDWAITYSATIELIPSEFDIFYELSRIVRKGMILVINESGHTYPRFYRYLHRINNFKIINIQSHHEKTNLIHSIVI
jgi:ubiquinone/menaquinone biosynthesis C-methylase UbiE